MSSDVSRSRAAGRVTQRSPLLAALIACILLVLVGYGYQSMTAASRRLASAQEDLQRCQEMADGISRMRQRPRVASLEFEAPGEISRRVTEAASKAQLPTDAIVDVNPQSPQRLSRSQYLSRATTIKLGAASVREIVEFCHHLADSEQGSTIRDVNLTTPREAEDDAEVWESEITLTQMIFSPTSG